MGRPAIKPSVDDPKAIEALCEHLASGLSVRKACAMPECPSETEVWRKQATDAVFSATIARARQAQQHALVDEMKDLADAATPEDWQVVRLQIWARQWTAGKLAPRIYGDRVTQEHSGQVGFVMYGEKEKASVDEWTQANSPDRDRE